METYTRLGGTHVVAGRTPSQQMRANERPATKLQCQECGRKFSRRPGLRTYEYKCPKCGSYDIDLA